MRPSRLVISAAHADPQIGAVLNLMRRYFGSAAFMMSELNQ